MVADFDGERGAVGIGDVGRVGDDDVEGLAGDGREKIALQKADSIGDVVALRILARDGERGCRDVDGGDLRRELVREGNGNAPEPVPTSRMRWRSADSCFPIRPTSARIEDEAPF